MPHVALIIETSKFYGREILLGIGRYLELHGPWSIFTHERGQNDPDPPWLARWKGDGIITRSLDFRLCRRALQHGIPVVSLRHLFEQPEFPTVFSDQRLIGERVFWDYSIITFPPRRKTRLGKPSRSMSP